MNPVRSELLPLWAVRREVHAAAGYPNVRFFLLFVSDLLEQRCRILKPMSKPVELVEHILDVS